MSSDVRVLIIDPDTSGAQKLGLALDGAGFPVTWCSFAPSDVGDAIRDFRPTVLLVRAELSSPQLATLLARVEAKSLPVVLLARDSIDQRFVRVMRTGVVEILQEPFSPRLHLNRLREVMNDLPQREGELSGRGARELNEVLAHLMRTRRTGGLSVGDDGRAFFVRGVLKAARFREHSMQAALASMVRESSLWRFTEGTDGTSAVVDFMGEDSAELPMEPTSFSQPTSSSQQSLPQVQAFSPPSPTVNVPPLTASSGGVAAAGIDPEAARTPILFVDDDPSVVQLLSNYFAKKGYPVATASDGLEAMQLISTRPFEVVVADLNMPRLDGWGFLRMVREDLRTHETPMALFSAQDNYRESLRLLQAGAQAYFPKTLRMAALEVQVKELCEPRRRFIRLVPTEGGIEFDFGKLGPQWVLKALTITGYTGQVDARDEWATWRLWFENGRLVQCTARMASTVLSGDRALASFITSRRAEGGLSHGTPAPDEGFAGHSTAATLSRLVPWLSDEQKRAAESQLSRARALTVNEELYRLFLTVGPPAWQPMVRLLCEQRLTPAEVIARLQVTPMEVAAVVKELLRRGVASLAA
ncbi:MAG: response regulator [Archangium sp.]